jgi:UDP-glucose:(heptosyl)LPS alpha-1,3-glucosyltransferase
VTIVIQIAPEIGPGSGVAAVAYHLEQELRSRGVDTGRFTLKEARGGWLPKPGPGVRGKAAVAARVVWFSTMGTVLARRLLRQAPDAVAICHNDALAGDVYVNHGIVLAAMRARGRAALRMVRNPLHLFTLARDTWRFAAGPHRVVVNLTHQEEELLRATYSRVSVPTTVIGNGVDTTRHRPPTDRERATARQAYGFAPDDLVVLFVGHEFDRKGLPVLLGAIAKCSPSVNLLVVGGTADMVAGMTSAAAEAGCADRVVATGRLADPTPAFSAADLFGFPSAYEAYPLVVLEALAHGLPVVATPIGPIPELVTNGVSGYLVQPDADQIAEVLDALGSAPLESMRAAARAVAEQHDWARVADRYMTLLESLGAEFGPLADDRALVIAVPAS